MTKFSDLMWYAFFLGVWSCVICVWMGWVS